MRLKRVVVAIALAALGSSTAVGASHAAAEAGADYYQETYRPQLHFTPEKNWNNDPNGLIFHNGEYHLFYQYNPEGKVWGNMSWGHAVSTDLVHWKHLPLAIPYSPSEHIFNGAVVVDKDNTAGFGAGAMVAVYTSRFLPSDKQAQSLAYSHDNGRTWTKYDGNPVLDINSRDFRDPKVVWDAKAGHWLMYLVLAADRKVVFYSSPNLKDWKLLSTFGPANATGGVWECPDLFPLKVKETGETKWVLIVNINPGGYAGGSGAQYFIGEWDGTKFTAENVKTGTPPDPAGTVFEDFESGYDGWTVTNDPAGQGFGNAPYPGTVPGQQTVTGYNGKSLVNSFLGGDFPTGDLKSAPFTITKDYINFLVGGGAHSWDFSSSGKTTAEVGPVADEVFTFEHSTTFEEEGWTATGDLANRRPSAGNNNDQNGVTGYTGSRLVNTYYDLDRSKGTLTSPAFTITDDYLNFQVGGGRHPVGDTSGEETVNLIVNGEVVRTATGVESGQLTWTGWNVSELEGKTAQLKIVDNNPGGWGHILVDQVVLQPTPVKPASRATAVNLVVDGQVVRSTSGREAEMLDWASWDVSQYVGKQAQIWIADHNRGGWGHINADHFMFGDAPAQPRVTYYEDWLDFGRDFYAAITWEGVEGGKRYAIAWMNNWEYAERPPTDPWRGAMTLTRELTLHKVGNSYKVFNEPINTYRELREGDAFTYNNKTISGNVDLPAAADGNVLEIQAEFTLGTAKRFGVKVRGGNGQQTLVGYDNARKAMYVDRTKSGATVSAGFPGVQTAPLNVDGNKVTMLIYVDKSSVEAFGNSGAVSITDLIFPDDSSTETALYTEGGSVKVNKFSVRQLDSIWN